jgi:N-acetylglucosaminyldiphosphoundecaprenol N-acetyl-beta-D-mannosaminyltransferase
MTDAERFETVSLINSAAPDVIWVGLSTPKQEKWMAIHRQYLDAAVLIGVGAAFDFNSGTKRQAPTWMRPLCLEWLFRLLMEPRRLWKRYLVNNPAFLFFLTLQRLGLRSYQTTTEANG